MFGTNALRKRVQDLRHTDGRYWVQEVFSTIQGEGPLVGEPAIFVRMAGCNLRCHFCDTDFESSEWNPTPDELLGSIVTANYDGYGARLVVFTGGEPLRQPLGPIYDQLLRRHYTVQIETAGTIWDTSINDYTVHHPKFRVVCSPKTGSVIAMMTAVCHDWKYIVSTLDHDPDDGLPIYSTQVPGEKQRLYRPEPGMGTIWVQPMEAYYKALDSHGKMNYMKDPRATEANTRLAVDLARRHGYRLSLQIHKLLNLP